MSPFAPEWTFGLTNRNRYPAEFRQWAALDNAAASYRDGTLALSREPDVAN